MDKIHSIIQVYKKLNNVNIIIIKAVVTEGYFPLFSIKYYFMIVGRQDKKVWMIVGRQDKKVWMMVGRQDKKVWMMVGRQDKK